MGKHSRYVGICDNDMQYPELHKKHSNVDGDIITHKLPKDSVVRAAWINAILKGRNCVHTFIMASLLGQLIIPSPEFNQINPIPVTQL